MDYTFSSRIRPELSISLVAANSAPSNCLEAFMPKSTSKNDTPDVPATNSSVDPQTGTVNPSAPTVGTEQWGNTSDERRVLGHDRPAKTQAGQPKRNPRNRRAEATESQEHVDDNRRVGDRAGKLEPVGGPAREHTDLSHRTSASTYTLNNSQDEASGRADVSNSGLWETSSDDEKDEEEVERQFEERWRHDRGLGDWTAAMHDSVRDHVHGR
jgi:hypothetical protein